MARSLDIHVAKLRKRSRILLARLEENSWKVNKEIKKLCLQTSFLNENSSQQPIRSPRISEFWQLRNDSRGVGGALCPDYFSLSPHFVSASQPNMPMQKRLLLSSKKRENEVQLRQPVKECYCNRLTRKMQFRSTRTKVKAAPCSHCRSLIDLRPMAWVESNDVQQTEPTTPVSCETIRRVQKINYSPQSEFLQNKISSTHNLLDGGSLRVPSKSTSTFLSRYPFGTGGRVQSEFKPRHLVCRNIPPESLNEFNDEPEFRKSAKTSEKCVCSHVSREFPVQCKKSSKETLAKRTISSKKVPSTSKDEQSGKTRSSHFTSEGRTGSYQSRPINEDQDLETFYGQDYFGEYDLTPKYSKQTREFLRQTSKTSKLRDKREEIDGERENEMVDLHKFREQNYFDTHGSTQTFLSSRSSGSLERYLLNERLFPQPAGKIHRGDLVVTMPPCATKQKKRVHYFPRYVVRQEKKNHEITGGKKKHSCPLTGHAIDVGALKTQHPSNSLALRFQKGVP